MVTALRFIHVADGLPGWMGAITAVVAVYGLVLTWLGGAETALGMVFLWQMLCASRGFAGPAANGYYDPLLVAEPRWRIASAHALHASSAGLGIWTLIGAVELIGGDGRSLAFDPPRIGAFAFVSVAAWALSLAGPRLVAGSIWLGLIFAIAGSGFGSEQYAALLQRAEGLQLFGHALAFAVLCPFVLLDSGFPMRREVSAAVTLAAAFALGAGIAFIVRRDYPLESST